MSGRKPPFRADHVGSLLRPERLREARARRASGEIGQDELKRIEDEEIARVVARQEEIGLLAVTDGEFRRAFWQIDFLERLPGVESYEGQRKMKFQGPQPKPVLLRTVGRIGADPDHPFLEHFRYVQSVAKVMPKMTIPSPTSVHFRYGREAISRDVYPEMEPFYADLTEAYRQMVHAFYDAGCRYLQLDEVNLAYLCDPALRDQVRERGDDPDTLLQTYARLIGGAIADRPEDMVISMHLCRGNFRSTFVASGGYEPVAEVLFNDIPVDGYFMEYDSDRAGDFAPLRFVPKGKTVVLGLVTSKTGELESHKILTNRISAAAKVLDPAQLALSPQCGFSSTEEGNLLTEDEQWRKMERIVEVARDVWGEV